MSTLITLGTETRVNATTTVAELQDGIGDNFEGRTGDDTIVAGPGNDVINGGLGANLIGGGGDDTFIVAGNEAFAQGESIDGGLGFDTLSLNDQPLFADFTVGSLTSIEAVVGSSLSDRGLRRKNYV